MFTVNTAAYDIASPAILREVVEAVLHGLVVVDRGGRIHLVNRQLESMFGYSREELIGAPLERLMPERYRASHGGLFASFFAAPSVRDMAQRRELFGRRKDGDEFPVEIGLNPVLAQGDLLVLATITDVTSRKAAQAQIERALAEKTVLLNEVHHRVKNNLQVVSSLLRMQARNASAEARGMLEESHARIRAMSLIHQLLYEHNDFSRIHLGAYLAQLSALLRDTYSEHRGAVKFEIHGTAQEITLDLHCAVPCGLLVNELISNALKHAFPKGRAGTVSLSLIALSPGGARVIVADDGIGIPESVQLGQGRSLGMRLLPSLAEQAGGTLVLLRDSGTRFELTLPSEARNAATAYPNRRG